MNKNREFLFAVILISMPSLLYVINNEVIFDQKFIMKILLLPFLMILFLVFLIVLAGRFVKMESMPRSVYYIVSVGIPLVFSINQFKYVVSAKNYTELLFKADYILMGLFLILLGNFLPKVKFNRFLGLKFWWLKDRKDIWFKAHLLAGYLWSFIGICLIFIGNKREFQYMLLYFIFLYIIPMIYALFLYFFTEDKSNIPDTKEHE